MSASRNLRNISGPTISDFDKKKEFLLNNRLKSTAIFLQKTNKITGVIQTNVTMFYDHIHLLEKMDKVMNHNRQQKLTTVTIFYTAIQHPPPPSSWETSNSQNRKKKKRKTGSARKESETNGEGERKGDILLLNLTLNEQIS